VVRFGDRTVAVEVKTVGGRSVAAIERIDDTKLRQVRRLANELTLPEGRPSGPVRVDFVGIHTTPEGVTVDWRRGVA
jgi:Holliday junction resolvase-like predicted endonuclease